MIDPRIYRAAFVPALCALVVVMFSIESRPEPLTAQLAPDAFDSARVITTTRAIARLAPDRAPGSEGNAAAAALIRDRFAAIGGGEVSLQRFKGEYRGRRVAMQNVILVLPGDSDRRLVVSARRDSPAPPGVLSSAAPTAALLELAENFGAARHRKTLVFVSTDGASGGAAGARRFAERFPGRDRIEAVLVLDQPATRDGRRPFLLPWSAGSQSTSVQLVQSAKTAIRQEVGRDPGAESWLGHFMRLALPIGLQEQAVMIERGLDAVTLSSNGELPVRPARDGLRSLSEARLDQFGRAALSLVLAIDANVPPLVHGPEAYVVFAGNIVPGWALALLSLAFLVPAAFTAVDGFARARRQRQRVGRWLRWLGAVSVPFVASLGVAHLLSLVGWIPNPGYPYDPQRYPLDAAAAAALAALAAVFALGCLVVRPLALPARLGQPAGHGGPAALALFLCAVSLGVWLLNPYASLLLVPAAHLWMFAVLPEVRRSLWQLGIMIVSGLVLPILAFAYVADRMDAGWAVVWQIVLLVTGGHVGLPLALAACLLGASFVGVLAIARAEHEEPLPEPDITVRGPVTYAGPGSLGGTSSALPRR